MIKPILLIVLTIVGVCLAAQGRRARREDATGEEVELESKGAVHDRDHNSALSLSGNDYFNWFFWENDSSYKYHAPGIAPMMRTSASMKFQEEFRAAVFSSHHIGRLNDSRQAIMYPHVPIRFAERDYWFDGNYFKPNPDLPNICVMPMNREIPFYGLSLPNGEPVRQILFQCPSGYHCFDFDCCQDTNSYFKWIGLALLALLVLIIGCLCVREKNFNKKKPEHYYYERVHV